MRTVLQGKYAGDTRNYQFDFSSYLAAGDSLSTTTQTASLYSGQAGGAPLVLSSQGVAANIATIEVGGGAVGNVYVLVVTGSMALGQLVSLNAFLPILPGQP